MWESLRQGARNVAGVTYQVAVTADLLVQGPRWLPRLPERCEVVPEGYEDVDCVLAMTDDSLSRQRSVDRAPMRWDPRI